MWNSFSNWLDAIINPSSKSAKQGWRTAAVWYGLNRISGNVGTLDMELIHEQGERMEVVKQGPVPSLWRRPSPIYTPSAFQQTMTAQALWHGNGRAAIIRNGRQSEMIILDPERTETGMVAGEKMHITYISPDGAAWPNRNLSSPSNRLQLYEDMKDNPERAVVLFDRDVFHVLGFGNGIVGVPLYYAAKTSLESMLGADSRANDQINRGFVAKIMLSAPENSPQFRTQEAANEFLDDFIKKHGADGQNQQVGLLRGGITANSISAMDNGQAQFLETRKYLRQDAALWLMLESMLGDNESESYNSLEHRQISYLLNCLDTWLTRWEEEADYKLLSSQQFNSGQWRHKFNRNKLLQTDLKTQAEVASQYIAARVWNPNEVRHSQGRNPYEGGDEFLNPAITTNTEPEETETPPDEEPATDTEARAVQSRLDVLLNQEQVQVNKRLARGDSIDAIEGWYENYQVRLSNAIESVGGSALLAQEHCVSSIRYLRRNPATFDLNGTSELLTEKILKR